MSLLRSLLFILCYWLPRERSYGTCFRNIIYLLCVFMKTKFIRLTVKRAFLSNELTNENLLDICIYENENISHLKLKVVARNKLIYTKLRRS